MLDAYRDLIDELLGMPAEVRGIAEPAPAARESSHVARLIAEFRDRDRAVLNRAQTVTRQESPYLRALPSAAMPDDRELDLASLLEEMETARGDLVSLLMNLSLKDWERSAIHETDGEITLADEIEHHVEWDEAQRQRLRELMSGAR